MLRMNGRKLMEMVPTFVASGCLTLFCLGFAMPANAGTKKLSKPITTADGKPIRKVYIRSASQDMESSAANQLAQDTCLVAVPEPQQADAVLKVGIALHAIANRLPEPSVPTPRPQSVNNVHSTPDRTATVNCSDGKNSSGCTGSYSAPTDEVSEPATTWPGNAGGNMDISLLSPGSASQELWEPNAHSDKSWSHQLRIAAGCPVCPDEHFNRHKYKTYRNWIQDKCPTVLTAAAQ
jgi:hypothetical protein